MKNLLDQSQTGCGDDNATGNTKMEAKMSKTKSGLKIEVKIEMRKIRYLYLPLLLLNA